MSNQQLSIENPTLHMLTLLSIKNDGETLKALVPVMKNSIYALGMLQYMALFCCAVEEYCKSTGQDVNFFKDSPFSISNIRCKLKLFDDRYGRTTKTIWSIDDEQDGYFSSLLRFKWLSRFQIHYNLGIYIDCHNHMIGNTQYMHYMFQDKRFSNRHRMHKENLQQLGYVLGSTINSFCEGLKALGPSLDLTINPIEDPLFYHDYNTNRNFNAFSNHEDGKELTLRLTHILCALNFIGITMKPVIPQTNLWYVRAKYITFYYAYRSIKAINNKFPQMINIPESSKMDSLLSSDFRSCMMHYGYINQGKELISTDHLNQNIPFYGLIESCFPGRSFNDFICDLDHAIFTLSDIIEKQLNFDFSSKKPL